MNHIDQSKLFSETFFEQYTDFESLEEFEDGLPVDLDDVKNGDSVDSEINEVVREHSNFDSFQDLIGTALEIWVRQNVDIPENEKDEN